MLFVDSSYDLLYNEKMVGNLWERHCAELQRVGKRLTKGILFCRKRVIDLFEEQTSKWLILAPQHLTTNIIAGQFLHDIIVLLRWFWVRCSSWKRLYFLTSKKTPSFVISSRTRLELSLWHLEHWVYHVWAIYRIYSLPGINGDLMNIE